MVSDSLPPPGEAAFERALYYERNGKSDAALAAYLQALEDAPDNLDIAFRTATALMRAGHLDEALSQLRRIVFIEPENVPARANLGNCQYLMGDLTTAEANFKEVLGLQPDNRNALYGLASVQLDLNKPEAAFAPAQKLVELLPQSAPVRTLFARSQSKDPQGSAAIASFRKALELDATHMPAITGLAELYLRRRRFAEAAVLAAQAHALEPQASLPLRTLADARMASGDLEGARDALSKALKACKSSERPELLLRFSALHRKAGDLDAALVDVFQAYQLAPRNANVLNTLGTCLAALKQGQMARQVLTAASRDEALAEGLKNQIAKAAADAEQTLAARATAANLEQSTSENLSDDEDDDSGVAEVTFEPQKTSRPESRPLPDDLALESDLGDELNSAAPDEEKPS
nr:tetratricopeptide repeat protein [Roseibium limicola]